MACPLTCPHCCTDAGMGRADTEIESPEAIKTVLALSGDGVTELYLSGGEPLLWKPIWATLLEAARAGMRTALASSGFLIDKATARRLAQVGIGLVHISLDGADAADHDHFRGIQGAFDRAIQAIGNLRDVGLEVVTSTLIRRERLATLERIVSLIRSLGVRRAGFNFMLPLGRGLNVAEDVFSDTERSAIARRLTAVATGLGDIDIDCRRANPVNNGLAPCPGGRNLFHIGPGLVVSPCPWAAKLWPELRRAWQGGPFVTKEMMTRFNLIKEAMSADCDDCPNLLCGRGCPLAAGLSQEGATKRDPICGVSR